jgi:glycerol kinase
MTTVLLGIDEGTTAVKVASFDLRLRPIAAARREILTSHPAPGWVEQDPEEVLAAVVDAVAEVLAATEPCAVAAVGLAHQGESVLAWDAGDGRALTPVIVWQDKRQEELLARLEPGAVESTGLPLDPYFSAGKLSWLIEHDDAVRKSAARGTLRMGTVDAFLTDRLGGRFATDLSTASRTQLLALAGEDWDPGLIELFHLRREWLPTLGPTFGALGELRSASWPAPLPLRAQLVDQQAALAGSGTVRPGEAKATYGTGVFVLGRTSKPSRARGLLPTVAWAGPPTAHGAGPVGAIDYAIDGGVFSAGALLDWLAAGLGLAPDGAALARMATGVADAAGVRVLPALAGLGAPWWKPQAHAVLAGLHGGVRTGHVAYAALEAIAHRVADVVEAMEAAVAVDRLRVDGGLTGEPTLLMLQADLLGLPLTVSDADMTVLGAALLAGVGAGVFASVEDAAALLPAGRTIEPSLGAEERARRRDAWREFVRRSAEL